MTGTANGCITWRTRITTPPTGRRRGRREATLDCGKFLSEVQANGSFTSREETEGAVASVLMAMAEVLPREQLQALATRLPPEAMVGLARSGSGPAPRV